MNRKLGRPTLLVDIGTVCTETNIILSLKWTTFYIVIPLTYWLIISGDEDVIK